MNAEKDIYVRAPGYVQIESWCHTENNVVTSKREIMKRFVLTITVAIY